VSTVTPSDTMLSVSKKRYLIGWPALVAAVIIWACFALSIRLISLSNVLPADVALIRFTVPALLLLPFVASRLSRMRRAPFMAFMLVSVGGGLPFFLIAAAGGRYATASYVGALIAGTTPISASIIRYFYKKQKITNIKAIGLLIIATGVGVLVASLGNINEKVILGIGILLIASFFWGSYTVGLKDLGVDPLSCVALVTYPSLLVLLLLIAGGAVESNILHYTLKECLPFIAMQGVGVGFFSTLFYAIAIQHLGTTRCATFGSLAPVVATFLAIPFLNEIPTTLSVIGVIIITAGVIYSNRYNQG
jgi:drug/metabolite transporter (DMT)-like permease